MYPPMGVEAIFGVYSSQRVRVVLRFGVGVSPNRLGVPWIKWPGVGVSPNMPPCFGVCPNALCYVGV